MFFILSKTLGYLVQPLVVVCLLFLASFVARRPILKRRLLLSAIVLIFFLSNEFIANEVINAWQIKATPFSSISHTYDYGILLTGAAKTQVGPEDRIYIASAADRINHTMQLYKMGRIRKIVVSGGNGRLIDTGDREADDLATLLRLMGVPARDILIENTSRNTHESAIEVRRLLEGKTQPSGCLLITSASHIRRARACFRKAGWPCDTFSADFHGHKRKFTFDALLIPKLEAVIWWQALLKESSGYATYWVAGYI